MADPTDIRPWDETPGPGDLSESGDVWMWDSSVTGWVLAIPSTPRFDHNPWLPGWALPVPPQGEEVG